MRQPTPDFCGRSITRATGSSVFVESRQDSDNGENCYNEVCCDDSCQLSVVEALRMVV